MRIDLVAYPMGKANRCSSDRWLRHVEVSQVADRVIPQSKFDSASKGRKAQALKLRIESELCFRTANSVRCRGVRLEDAVWTTSEHVAMSDPSLIAGLRDKITNAAEEAGASSDAVCDIKIAVGEALTNAYRHGSPEKGASRIQVRCRTCSSAVVVEVEDEGAPFDFNATPEPDRNMLKDHGMGLYLMRQTMDEVNFANNCPGNRVLMVKWLKDD